MRLGLPEPLRMDALHVDALRTDAYVESLISGAASATTGPAGHDGPDPDVAAVARLLHASAVRPHPSFRFEERVATRIAAVARGAAATTPATILAFPAVPATALASADASDAPQPRAHPGRAVAPIAGLASAAFASAALSIGAAAVVAWRRGRPRRGIA